MGIIQEFRDFAIKGNVVDLAVGVIIGAAFGRIVSTLVDRVLMPPLGLAIGGVDFSELRLVLQPATEGSAEVAIYYGEFMQAMVIFMIVAAVLFFVVKGMNTLRRQPPPLSAPTPEDITLLREIRDLLKKSS